MSLLNPYKSPTRPDTPSDVSRMPSWISTLGAWIATLGLTFPFLLLVAVYGTWCMAWVALRHQPIPSVDDPKSINTFIFVLYIVTEVLLISCPLTAIIGVGAQFCAGHRTWQRRFLLATILVVLWVVVIAVLIWDPMGIMVWLAD